MSNRHKTVAYEENCGNVENVRLYNSPVGRELARIALWEAIYYIRSGTVTFPFEGEY